MNTISPKLMKWCPNQEIIQDNDDRENKEEKEDDDNDNDDNERDEEPENVTSEKTISSILVEKENIETNDSPI
jgi:hypothetical protein